MFNDSHDIFALLNQNICSKKRDDIYMNTETTFLKSQYMRSKLDKK